MNTKITALIISLALLIGCEQKTVTPVVKQEPRKILYYRDPMGLPDTSSVPKKDSMGMDYLPVYEGEQKSTGK